ncbi:MAG: ParB/RepB/Spo0J family partition protein [Sphingopyxis sp.]|nr:ParB/RepB/Spo0J family partition protein [Sphingopyxis sp.]
MKLDFIELDKLSVAKTNMRAKGRDPEVGDILPSIRKRGVLIPLLVRPNCADGHFEILAGRRRFTAVNTVVREGGAARPLPCAILDDGDDADAIEVSLLENLARVAPDEVSQWEAFVKLAKAGRSEAEIAADFAFEPQTVKRILALGNLLPRIRNLYRAGDIDPSTVKHLTLASKAQQTAWLALFDDADAYCPTGSQLKEWLFGGGAIKAEHALFDIETSGLAIIADLFSEDRLVPDTDAFWALQMAEVEARKAAYLEDGWSDVVILERGTRFITWNHSHTAKRKGGRVYVEVRSSGEVDFHEGYLTEKEAAARARASAMGGEQGALAKVQRPEITSAMNSYINLHRHAAVRAELAKHGGVALRALAAHVIAGADHYRVDLQSYVCAKDEVQESVETCASEVVFDERRRAVLAVLGFDPEDLTVTARHGERQFAPIFARLLELPDPVVLEIVAIVMGETLDAGSEAVEMIGQHLAIDMAPVWQADAAFWSLVRDKEVLGRIVTEVAGADVAAANAGAKAKVLKTIVADHLEGTNGRAKSEPWVPRWMAFPPAPYTPRGGIASVSANDRLLHILARAAEAGNAEGDGMEPGADANMPGEAEGPSEPEGDAGAEPQAEPGDVPPWEDEEESPLAA